MLKFITIGYGDQAGYERTPASVRDAAHTYDADPRKKGVLMGIAGAPMQVRNPYDNGVEIKNGPFMVSNLPVAGLRVTDAKFRAGAWLVKATGSGEGRCPDCGCSSSSRHSGYVRVRRDLPVQRLPVMLEISLARLRCREPTCARVTFVEPAGPELDRFARMTRRVRDIVVMTGHTAGGRPTRRLLHRSGLPGSTDTILRHLKRRAAKPERGRNARVVGIDDWAWRKGYGSYGTIIIDLERHEVLDVMQDRTADSTARWFRDHPAIEIISRDRCGLYAQGARECAPQAQQCADRFHILQNFRHAFEPNAKPLAPGAKIAFFRAAL